MEEDTVQARIWKPFKNYQPIDRKSHKHRVALTS
jgi:hypothetical protein